jgi:nucleoside-diphosphate-sugar epimerase
MRVLLTGATGFIGSHLARRLVSGGRHEVAALVRRGSSASRIADILPRLTRIEGDLNGVASWGARAAEFGPDAVLHLGWGGVASKNRNDPAQTENVASTVALVQLAASLGARHFIGLGSQGEYGPHAEPIDESAPARPTTLYGVAKLSAGLFAAHLCREAGLRFAWLRLFSAYGEANDTDWMIPYLILKLLDGERPSLTEGTQAWDFIHVDDVTRAIEAVLETPAATGVFNLASGHAVPLRRVVEQIRDSIDPSLPLGFGEVPFRPDQVMRLEAVVDRLRGATGWEPRVDLDEGVRRTIAWYRQNRRRHAS